MLPVETKEHVSDTTIKEVSSLNDNKNAANENDATNEPKALLVAGTEPLTAAKAELINKLSETITDNLDQSYKDSAVLNNDKTLDIVTSAMSTMILDEDTKITAEQPTTSIEANVIIDNLEIPATTEVLKDNDEENLPTNKKQQVFPKRQSRNSSSSEPMLYLNPITLDAQYFLNTIQANIASCANLDPALVDALETVMLSINKILQQNDMGFVVETEQVKFVDPLQLQYVKRGFVCTKCHCHIGDTATLAAAHLANRHKLDGKNSKRTREKKKSKKKEKKIEEAKKEVKNYKNNNIVEQGKVEKGVRELPAEMKTEQKNNKNQAEKDDKDHKNSNNVEENQKTDANKRQRIRSKKANNNKKEKQKLPKKARALINNNMQNFFVEHTQLAQALKHIHGYDYIEKDLMELLKVVFPKQPIKLYKFGSRISGIGTRDSDLDIYVDINNTFGNFENRPSVKTISQITIVRDALRKNKDKWKNLVAVINARVPILKILHSSTGIECDIGFSNSLGYCNTKLVEYLIELQPVTRCLCIFMKKWLDRARLSMHFSSYSLALMVIYYLQVKKLLPSVRKLQVSLGHRVCVGPWIVNFAEQSLSELKIDEVNMNTGAVKILLENFFEFYANFAFDKYVICPYMGIANIESNQIELIMPKSYHDFVQTSGANFRLEIVNKSIIVQDPIQLNHNVTKHITASMLKLFKDFIIDSKQLFSELK